MKEVKWAWARTGKQRMPSPGGGRLRDPTGAATHEDDQCAIWEGELSAPEVLA